jgi:predicted GIY-YIG superfamily endonuclease
VYYVYLIRSISDSSKTYVGYTTNLKQRLKTHNSGGSVYTLQNRPWRLVMYLAFDEEEKALAFEKYIKIGSGYAFAQKRFW